MTRHWHSCPFQSTTPHHHFTRPPPFHHHTHHATGPQWSHSLVCNNKPWYHHQWYANTCGLATQPQSISNTATMVLAIAHHAVHTESHLRNSVVCGQCVATLASIIICMHPSLSPTPFHCVTSSPTCVCDHGFHHAFAFQWHMRAGVGFVMWHLRCVCGC